MRVETTFAVISVHTYGRAAIPLPSTPAVTLMSRYLWRSRGNNGKDSELGYSMVTIVQNVEYRYTEWVRSLC